MRIGFDCTHIEADRDARFRTLVRALLEIGPEHRYLFWAAGLRVPGWRGLVRGDLPAARQRTRIPRWLIEAAWDRFQGPVIERFVGEIDLLHSPVAQLPPAHSAKLLATLNRVDDLTAGARAVRRTLERAAGYVTWSNHLRRRIIETAEIAPERVAVVPPGVVDFFKVLPEDVSPTLHAFPKPFLLVRTSDRAEEQTFGLVEAFSIFAEKATSPYHLLLVGGDPPDFALSMRLAEVRHQASQVHFPGEVSPWTYRALLNHCEAFLCPEPADGSGVRALEAMACGAPVLAADHPAHREVLGEEALYFDPKDAEGTARRIEELLDADGIGGLLRRRGPLRARRYSWRRSALRVLEVYRRVLAGEPLAEEAPTLADAVAGAAEHDGWRDS